MFTGIIEDVGQVASVKSRGDVHVLDVHSSLDLTETRLGDSIAVNGVCLTVTRLQHEGAGARVSFDVGPESRRVSALGTLGRGDRVHLERAMRLGGRLDGHLVQGHVDGVGVVEQLSRYAETLALRLRAPLEVMALCIPKGSIAIDGVSLTVNEIFDGGFSVWLVPHTLKQTNLGQCKPGQTVNLENDLIGKYVQRLIQGPRPSTEPIADGVTWELLARNGFAAEP